MFPKLTPAQLARLERHSTSRSTTVGEILVDVGTEPRGVFVLVVQFVHRALHELPEPRESHAAI